MLNEAADKLVADYVHQIKGKQAEILDAFYKAFLASRTGDFTPHPSTIADLLPRLRLVEEYGHTKDGWKTTWHFELRQ